MLTQQDLEILAGLTMHEDEPARLFPGAPLGDGLYADAMLVREDSIVCFVDGINRNMRSKEAKEIIAQCESIYDGGYLMTDWSARRLSRWGTVVMWNGSAFWGAVAQIRKPDLNAQLSLLWKEELRKVLKAMGRELPPADAPKAELITRLTAGMRTKKQRQELERQIRHALLTRDYASVGRDDYTYRISEDKLDRLFGWVDPDDPMRLPDRSWIVREAFDDPEDRHAPLVDMSTPAARASAKGEAERRATALISDWRKRKIRVAPTRRPQIVASILEEMRGKDAPAYRSFPKDQTHLDTAATEKPEGWVGWEEIKAVPGVPWIDEQIIEDFARFLVGGKAGERKQYRWTSRGVMHSPLTGKWQVQHSRPSNWTRVDYARLESTFGIPGYNGLRILESLLNVRQPKLEDEEATLAVLEKQDLILDLFEQWLWRDPARRNAVEKRYNEIFSSFRPNDPDGTDLVFPGMSDEIQLYDYQKNAVKKILTERNSLLAFDTGSGKTYIMIAAAMKMRESGESPKNMFVVPNNIVGQWEQMFLQMYPDAKLLVVDPARFKPDMRADVLRKMRKGNYDGIIIAYSCLEQIPLSKKWVLSRLKKQTDQLQREEERAEYEAEGFHGLSRQLELASEAMEAEASKLLKQTEKAPPRSIMFDHLGITGIFLDEAHNYKNVPVRTALGSIGGLNPTGSVKCLAMLNKVRCVQESPGGRGAVLATATPLSNSLADAFVMQQYVQPDELQKIQLHTFDNWVKSFARPELVCEIDVDTSRFRYVKRLARFYNIPELSRMFSSATAFYAMDKKDGLPTLSGYTNVLIHRGEQLHKFMDKLVERTERIRNGRVARSVDNMLKVSTEGRLGALDLRLVGFEQPYDETSKIHACVSKVLDIYHRYDGCTQIVFCDYSTPKSDAFNVYDDVKKHLIDAGVPENEIAFIHSYSTEAKKLQLYRKVNSGEIRVLIGSTFKLGIGTNVQTRLKAIHHLDIPWRPADMVQREGRILRQGNLNASIQICRYISEGSFDAYSWQILERKQTFISQFLSGSAYERSATDLEDAVLTYGQVKSLAINEPLMKDLAEKENELRKARMLASNFVQANAERREALEKQRAQLTMLKTHTDITKQNAEYAKTLSDADVKEANSKFKDLFAPELLHGSATLVVPAPRILDFAIGIDRPEGGKNVFAILERGGADYRVKLGQSPAGNIRRVLNFIRKLSSEQERLEKDVQDLSAKIQGAEAALAEENPFPKQIDTLTEEIRELRAKITERQVEQDLVAV